MELERVPHFLGMSVGQEALFVIVAIILYNVFIYYFTQTNFAYKNDLNNYWILFFAIPVVGSIIYVILFGIYSIIKFIVLNW